MAQESMKERRNRELGELLQEMRVAITGVQVMFAFLLTLPFTDRYARLHTEERWVHILAVISAALSSLLLIAPTAMHRLTFREGTKEALLQVANRLVLVALVLLAAGIGLSLYLVTSVVFSTTFALVISVAVVAVTAVTWFVLPHHLPGDVEQTKDQTST